MNLVYRIVHALLAIAVFPAILFLQLFYIEVSPNFIDYGMSLEFSLYQIFDLFGGGSKTSSLRNAFTKESLSNIWSVFADAHVSLVLMIASGIITLALTVFIIVACIVKGKRKVLLTASSIGFVTSILFKVFSAQVCKTVTSGEVDFIKIFSQSFIAGFFGDLISVDTLRIGVFSNAVLMLFMCMVIWSVIYIVTDIGLEEEKPASPAKKK